MPTISELLEGCVAVYVKAGTRPCWSCTATPPLNESNPCERCGGSRESVPAPHDLGVHAAVTAEILRLVVQLRAASRWDAMNEALDWGTEYLDACLQAALSDPVLNEAMQSAIEKVMEAGAEVRDAMQERPTLRPASGLSTAELEELGVLEP